jgi:SAM-dependent methyltransferase
MLAFMGRVFGIVVKRPHSEDLVRFAQTIEQRAQHLYDRFYSRYGTFAEKDVFELGAGPYAVRTYLALGVRSYTLGNVRFGPEFDLVSHPALRRVATTDTSIPLDDASVDIVISENTFEHLRAYEAMIAEVRRVLRPGGMLLTQFSPLYASPFGAHLYEVIMIPWIHLIMGEQRLRALIERESRTPESFAYQWEQYTTLNQLEATDFLRPLRGPGWTIQEVTSFPFVGSRHWPGPLSRWFTHGLRIAARKT